MILNLVERVALTAESFNFETDCGW